jgi:hypothetical protein
VTFAIAFGFVYIHPCVDGNGRLHRCLIHHVLSERSFAPPEMIFPVSAVMARKMDEYRKILRSHSSPLMAFVQWKPNLTGSLEVTNDTADLYKYFDCTEAAEFLYRCVLDTIEIDVPQELDYLRRHDKAVEDLMNTVEMPNRMAGDFIFFMWQNNWKLPEKRRTNEFAKLTDEEVDTLQTVVRSAFAGFPQPYKE